MEIWLDIVEKMGFVILDAEDGDGEAPIGSPHRQG